MGKNRQSIPRPTEGSGSGQMVMERAEDHPVGCQQALRMQIKSFQPLILHLAYRDHHFFNRMRVRGRIFFPHEKAGIYLTSGKGGWSNGS